MVRINPTTNFDMSCNYDAAANTQAQNDIYIPIGQGSQSRPKRSADEIANDIIKHLNTDAGQKAVLEIDSTNILRIWSLIEDHHKEIHRRASTHNFADDIYGFCDFETGKMLLTHLVNVLQTVAKEKNINIDTEVDKFNSAYSQDLYWFQFISKAQRRADITESVVKMAKKLK